MGKGKRMAGLLLITALLFCQVIVASASTQGAWNAEYGYSDAYACREYYHFDFTEEAEAENEPKSESVLKPEGVPKSEGVLKPEGVQKSENVPNPGFWIGLGTTAVGGLIAAVIITKKKSEDEG